MWIISLALRRPYTFVVIGLAILLLGMFAIVTAVAEAPVTWRTLLDAHLWSGFPRCGPWPTCRPSGFARCAWRKADGRLRPPPLGAEARRSIPSR
jgi:hypothetical protein